MFHVYKVARPGDVRVYIGRTKHPDARWKHHKTLARTGRCQLLHDAMRAHGIDAFSFEILETHSTLIDAQAAEVRLIADYRANHPGFGFNQTPGGDDTPLIGKISARKRIQRRIDEPEKEFARLSAAAKKGAAKIPIEDRRARMRKVHESMGVEKMRENGRKATASRTTEQWKEISRKAILTMGPDGLRAKARKAVATLGPEGLSARAKKTVQAQTPEQRSDARRRSWETRRRAKLNSA